MPATLRTKADAKNRSARTIAQNILGGVLSVALVAASGAVLDTVTPGQLIDWASLGVATGTAVLGAVAAYVQRMVEDDRSH